MAAIALVVTKERHSLDSRFVWSPTLGDSLAVNAPVIVYQSSKDSDEDVIAFMMQLYKADNRKKFIYIENDVNPLIASVVYGIGGVVCDDLFALSSNEVLCTLIDDYQNCDFIVKQPVEQFSELQKAMERILSDSIGEEELHQIITSPGWLAQIRASMKTVKTSLVQVKETNTKLAEYVDHQRIIYTELRNRYSEVNASLQKALKAQTAATVSTETSHNIINSYPAVMVPQSATDRVLYIKCLSECAYLLSFLFAYQLHLSAELSVTSRILIIKPDSKRNRQNYSSENIMLLHSKSIGSPTNKHVFLTYEPKRNVIDYFFNDMKARLFIVVDDFEADILLKGPKMRTLYATGNPSLINRNNISPNKVFCPVGGPPGAFILPFITDYANKTTPSAKANAYSNRCYELFSRLDALNGFED